MQIRSAGGAQAHPVGEENFFEGTGLVGFIEGCCLCFPGIPRFGVLYPESQEMAIPANEFISFGGLGGAINASKLKLLDLLHIETISLRK